MVFPERREFIVKPYFVFVAVEFLPGLLTLPVARVVSTVRVFVRRDGVMAEILMPRFGEQGVCTVVTVMHGRVMYRGLVVSYQMPVMRHWAFQVMRYVLGWDVLTEVQFRRFEFRNLEFRQFRRLEFRHGVLKSGVRCWYVMWRR